MAEQLNVLVVVIDGARADHVSSYGYTRQTTPFLDEMARDGVRFPNMIASAPGTLSAHAALFTGLPAVAHGATDENRHLSARHRLLPECLKAAGYRTAGFCTNPWVSPETGFGRGLDAFFTQRYHNRLAAQAMLYGRRASDRLLRRKDAGARRTTDAVQRWLAASDQPFFAFVHYNEAHAPLQLPPPYDRLFVPKGIGAARVHAMSLDRLTYRVGHTDVTGEDALLLTALYDGGLRYVDHRLREIADFLHGRGEWERTLCVVTADHGEYLGDHGMNGHHFGLYDSVLRIPLVMRCPTRVPQGFVVDELAQTTDVMPTILRLLDIPNDGSHMQGRALLDGGRVTPGPAFTVSERFRPNLSALEGRFPDLDTRPLDVRTKAIRTRHEKFVWHSDEANELYDLGADPGETINVIERAVDRADALRRQLFDWLAAIETFESEEPAPALDDRVWQQLRGFGYLDRYGD